jgi:hypothetical protein
VTEATGRLDEEREVHRRRTDAQRMFDGELTRATPDGHGLTGAHNTTEVLYEGRNNLIV